jgi:GNAT superfamily N-acetyltransferase
MRDLDYIVNVANLCPHTLGFIPWSTIQRVHLARGLWLPITSRRGRRVGFMLHGPLRADYPLRIYQCAVEPDHRLKEAATRAVAELKKRARDCGAPEIILRCRQNLEANLFWLALGAQLVDVHPGGLALGIPVNEYRLPVPTTPPPARAEPRSQIGRYQRSKRPLGCL